MVVCLERSGDLHMALLMALPLTVSCFSKIQIGFTFLVQAHPCSPGEMAIKRVYVCFNLQSRRCGVNVSFCSTLSYYTHSLLILTSQKLLTIFAPHL